MARSWLLLILLLIPSLCPKVDLFRLQQADSEDKRRLFRGPRQGQFQRKIIFLTPPYGLSLPSICLRTASVSCSLALPKSQLPSPAFQREACFSHSLIPPRHSLLGIKTSETKTKDSVNRPSSQAEGTGERLGLPWKRGSQNDNVLHAYHPSN